MGTRLQAAVNKRPSRFESRSADIAHAAGGTASCSNVDEEGHSLRAASAVGTSLL